MFWLSRSKRQIDKVGAMQPDSWQAPGRGGTKSYASAQAFADRIKADVAIVKPRLSVQQMFELGSQAVAAQFELNKSHRCPGRDAASAGDGVEHQPQCAGRQPDGIAGGGLGGRRGDRQVRDRAHAARRRAPPRPWPRGPRLRHRDRARDEVGRLLSAMGDMQSQLKDRIARDARISAENGRIKEALDNSATAVMLADADYR